MDHATKELLKHDQFVDTTASGIEWVGTHRRRVLTIAAVALGLLLLAIVASFVISHQNDAAVAAFGTAMQTYQAPLTSPDQPAEPGVKTYSSAKERATAANAQFLAVADKYGWTTDGKNARYLAGLTYLDMGQTQTAESTLTKVAGGWDKQLSSLAKEALADLYHQTGRDPQAIDLYNQLTDHPTDAVPANLAQIELAELYTAQGKIDQAHKIYAQLKDKDKNSKGVAGPAGALAAQKLNPTPAGGPQL